MSILNELSSQIGERSEEGNRNVAGQCIEDPSLLREIVEGLHHEDAKLQGDCAEVFTTVGEERPEFVAPYANKLLALLNHDQSRPRWESVHALAHVAALRPDLISSHLERIDQMAQHDSSKIAQRYAIELVSQYVRTGVNAAREAYPILIRACDVRDGANANVALNGLAIVAVLLPEIADELKPLAERFMPHPKGVVADAAKMLAQYFESDE